MRLIRDGSLIRESPKKKGADVAAYFPTIMSKYPGRRRIGVPGEHWSLDPPSRYGLGMMVVSDRLHKHSGCWIRVQQGTRL